MSDGVGQPDDGVGLGTSAIDAVLKQGTTAAHAAFAARVAADPFAAVELAETMVLVEQCRSLRVEPSARFDRQLAALVRRASLRVPAPRRRWFGPLLAAAVAVVAYAGLRWWDPIGSCLSVAPVDQHGPIVREHRAPHPAPRQGAPEVVSEAGDDVPEVGALLFADTLERVRERLDREASPHLRDALDAGMRGHDELAGWVQPRNTLARMCRDHELRASAAARRELLQRTGGLADADPRAQQLADEVAGELSRRLTTQVLDIDDLESVSAAVRSLVAAGPVGEARATAVRDGGAWLVARLPELGGARLVVALAALVEVAATGVGPIEVTAQHGRRLVDEVLRLDGQNWERTLPELVGAQVDVRVLGEAGRLLARLPGLDVDGRRAGIVRQLLLGQVRTRRAHGQDRPEVLAALLYGFVDLLPEGERDEAEHQLLRWKPARLVPDFATVQQQVWALLPGRRGFTRLQAERRQLAVLPTPPGLRDRAGLCLCLCADFAAFQASALAASAGE